MSIKFWIGAPGSGKSTQLLTELIERSQVETRRRFFIIVPEQFTMQTQKEITRLHPHGGILNIDVLSFARLAGRVFEETGVATREILSETGKRFLIRRVISKKKNAWIYLGAQLDRPGNIDEVKSMLSELLLYGIRPEDLKRGADSFGDTPLGRKCAEVGAIYEAFSEELQKRYMTAEEIPDYLARALKTSDILKDSVIAFDGYTGFTPVQMELLGDLMQRAEVHVTATINADAKLDAPLEEGELFLMSRKMMQGLRALAKASAVEVLPPSRIVNENTAGSNAHPGRFADAPDLRHLSDTLFQGPAQAYTETPASIELFAALSVAEEVAEVARRIAQVVREEGLRYRDIAVLTGDMARYGNEMRQAFTQMDIPFFMDEKRRLIYNPFIEYLRALLEICTDDFSFESIGRLLMTGFTPLVQREVDELMRYLPARGIRGRKKWEALWTHPMKEEDPGKMLPRNEVRERLCALLLPLAEAFAKRGGTVREKTKALYACLVESRCEERLHAQAEAHQAAGRVHLAQEYKQVYPQIMRMLDKLVDLLGDEKISRADYRELIEAGLLDEQIGIIPPGADQVTIGDMERTRLSEPKLLFFVGLNEGVLPRVDVSGGMFSEQDREALRQQDIILKPSPRESIANDRFYTYLALTRASKRLILSYAELSAEGEGLRPAYLVKLLQEQFPALALTRPPQKLEEVIERPAPSLSLLALSYAEIDTRDPDGKELELSKWYRGAESYRDRMDALYHAADAKRPQDAIARAVAQTLYGRQLVNSPTRLEKFAACAFAHYLRYGLRLQEEEEYIFTGMDTGNVIHDALERFAARIEKEELVWADLQDETRDRMAAECVKEAALSYRADLFTDNEKNAYEITRMSRLTGSALRAIQVQLKAGDFEPAAAEMAFRAYDDHDALRYILPTGEEMILTGRIDRLDLCRTDAADYLKIMDYKTGHVELDMNKVYHGLQLQLVIYLQAAMDRLKREGIPMYPAGVFYYPIKDPVAELQARATSEEVYDKLLKEMRPSGLALATPDAIAHLDRALATGQTESKVYALKKKKDGSLNAKSKAATAEQFLVLGKYVQKKVYDLGAAMMAGGIAIDPYRIKKESACNYCAYRNVCGFDEKIPGYRYRYLKPKKDPEVFAKMEIELSGEGT